MKGGREEEEGAKENERMSERERERDEKGTYLCVTFQCFLVLLKEVVLQT